MFGYAGKILRVNLTDGSMTTIDTSDYEQWGGGHGIGSAIFFDLVKKSDVVLHNFPPGTRLASELSYEELGKLKPSIIVANEQAEWSFVECSLYKISNGL